MHILLMCEYGHMSICTSESNTKLSAHSHAPDRGACSSSDLAKLKIKNVLANEWLCDCGISTLQAGVLRKLALLELSLIHI